MKSSAGVEIVIEHEDPIFRVACAQTSQDGRMTTFGALHAQAMIVQQLMQHLGKSVDSLPENQSSSHEIAGCGPRWCAGSAAANR